MMNESLLIKLADMLEADANNPKGLSFDLSHIGTFKYEFGATSEEYTRDFQKWIPAPTCNTQGCAMGLAAMSGEFPGLGWQLCTEDKRQITIIWEGRDTDYEAAACHLFGISQRHAEQLFSPWSYPFDKRRGYEGEMQVVARIRQLVETGEC